MFEDPRQMELVGSSPTNNSALSPTRPVAADAADKAKTEESTNMTIDGMVTIPVAHDEVKADLPA